MMRLLRPRYGDYYSDRLLVDHRDAALERQHAVTVDRGHRALQVELHLALNADHHALDRNTGIVDRETVAADLERDGLHGFHGACSRGELHGMIARGELGGVG